MKTKLFAFFLFAFFLSPYPVSGQGFFKGVGVPAAVASTGQTEPIGLILVAMTSGPLVADTLVINLSPLQITNANSSDIEVQGNGMVVGVPVIDTVNNLVEIPVAASLTSTGSISIQGIRVAVAGTNINSFNAQLSWLNFSNVFITGSSVPVISSAQTPVVARSIANPSVISTGQSNVTRSTIQVAEGFPEAFSSSLQYGQTGPTQIQITVTDFPAGEVLQFPVSIRANETAATLSITGSGATLSGSGKVTYAYSSSENAASVAESFNLSLDLMPPSNVQPTISVTLAPIGAAVPNSVFPATNIPRYAESEILVPPSQAPRKILYWTGVNPTLQNQIEVTNTASQPSKLTIDAFDSKGNAISGTGVAGPVTLTLGGSQSMISTLSNLFSTVAGVSSIRIQSTSPDVVAAAIITGNGANQSVPFVAVPVASLIVPVVSESAQLYVMNTTIAPITGTITLITATGNIVSTAPVNLAPLASRALTVQTAFGVTPQSGYASAVFSDLVIAYESFGTGNLQPIQPPTAQPSVFVPFIAGGSSFRPSVKLINVSQDIINLSASLFAGNGSLSATQPITMQPGQELVETMQQMFSQSPDTAYIEFDLSQIGKGIFVSYPLISGQAQIETLQGGSAVIPFAANPSSNAFILGQAISPAAFEGIAFLNPTATNVTVSIQALKLDGSVAATATLTLGSRQLTAELTNQLFSVALPAQTIIHITSSAPILATAMTGSTALDQIFALPVM
jgi:hypothetical protein